MSTGGEARCVLAWLLGICDQIIQDNEAEADSGLEPECDVAFGRVEAAKQIRDHIIEEMGR